MTRSLLAAFGRSRPSAATDPETSSSQRVSSFSTAKSYSKSKKPKKVKSQPTAASSEPSTSSRATRRCRFDDKSGPPPPRGSLTRDKLSYLDWRLQRINAVRATSERTAHSWIDGRDTIGRTSIDVHHVEAAEEDDEIQVAKPPSHEEAARDAPAPRSVTAEEVSAPVQPVIQPIPATIQRRNYRDEKEAAIKAIALAMVGDNVIASMPRLSKRDSTSGSDVSGSSDHHDARLCERACTNRSASADKDKRASMSTRPSFLQRAGRHLSSARIASPGTTTKSRTNTETAALEKQRTARPLTRIWQRRADVVA
ncbi:hypothetical protein BCV70DRAFT_198313 [Testicularia cyperi]|uniref:Uncharacterized protein n=1 Tax=Testicularia cyperi TaxID=1882483 RepID=A0A317XUP6_9BASI|nr:hypothetical protein BCV70DRAFT_198313 [Testicularia cyperi]